MSGNKKPWADGPFELIPSSRVGSKKGQVVKGSKGMAEDMVIIHNIILRIINTIYLQCVNVESSPSPSDVEDFVDYAYAWAKLVQHHSAEEDVIFPEIERVCGEPGLMGNNVEQHQAFHGGLEIYSEYLTSVKNGKEKYNGLRLKGVIDSFMPILRQHLNDEVSSLLALEKYEDKTDWINFSADIQAQIRAKDRDPNIRAIIFPMALTNRDTTFEGGVYARWPPVPWIASIILKWIFIPKHSNWWKFSSCDSNGVPKDLPFA